MKQHIDTYVAQADNLRFKLLAIVGKDKSKRDDIIQYLETQEWKTVDVSKELLNIGQVLDDNKDVPINIGHQIKEWFNTQPDQLIMLNAGILYHKSFRKISPVGAFKYNSRSKQCIIFLEDENLVSNRLYYGSVGSDDYKDQEVNDFIVSKIEDVKEDYKRLHKQKKVVSNQSQLSSNAIGRLFDFTQIKDVVDIDSDLDKIDLQKELISSFIISERLERQIIDFFENIENPEHKAVKIVGNYGSGKSHLIAFLVSVISHPEYANLIQNQAVKKAVNSLYHPYKVVQFELMSGEADLSAWFYDQIEKQFKRKYNLNIFIPNDIDHKDKIKNIIEQVKANNPEEGLLVVMDEVSDFLQQKPMHLIKRDLQFLRGIAQLCQSEDLMVVTSMQEDIYASPKFKDIAAQESRISERFQNITIHKEDVAKVIAQRIVPKSKSQRSELSSKFEPFAKKIQDIRYRLEEYIDIFPLTPFLLDLFQKLSYFEKRGAIQFAQKELRYVLNEEFPFFITFDKIYDILLDNPNLRNLEEIHEINKVVDFVIERIKTSVDEKYQRDAFKIVKGLAIYRLWSDGQNGATAEDLAEKLVLISDRAIFEAKDHVTRIVKIIKDATDGEYLQVVDDVNTGTKYFKLDPKIKGGNPDEKIDQEVNTVGEDEIENEVFKQISEILGLSSYQNSRDVFEDECRWESVKSFRKGVVFFARKHSSLTKIADFDYVTVIVSPFRKNPIPKLSENQINFKINVKHEENIEHFKRIVAIRKLIEKKILTGAMLRKLLKEVDGDSSTKTMGIKYKIARWANSLAECTFNGNSVTIHTIVKNTNNFSELLGLLQQRLLDSTFNKQFSEHPKYSMQLTSENIKTTLSDIARRIVRGDFQALQLRDKDFLKSLNLLDQQGFPDIENSKIAFDIFLNIRNRGQKVTHIEKDLVIPYSQIPYGIEPEIIHFMLIVMTTLGKITLKLKGGSIIDISNINDTFKSLSEFETITYAQPKADDEYRYDFAVRLFNTLGLNGNQMLNEKLRNTAFRGYKEKVKLMLQDFSALDSRINRIMEQHDNHIDTKALKVYRDSLDAIDFKQLDIANFTKFNTLISLSDQLPQISEAIESCKNLQEALYDYQGDYYQGIAYMKEALGIMEKNTQYLTSDELYDTLKTYYTDTLEIVKNFKQYLKKDERQPLKGKIKQFKNGYIHKFYIPAFKGTIGDKVDWDKISLIKSHDSHHRLEQLVQLNCVAQSKFRRQVGKWESLLSYRTVRLDIGKLENIPFDTISNFMRNSEDYSLIQIAINSIDDDLNQLKTEYEADIVREIIKSRDNLKHANINDRHRVIIQTIIKTQKLQPLDNSLITSINQLFKDYDIVTISEKEIIETLFEQDSLMTIGQLNTAMDNLKALVESKAKKNAEIRIKLG
jgi:energy-coupling factor transporter ATP-binding protein EcfA2